VNYIFILGRNNKTFDTKPAAAQNTKCTKKENITESNLHNLCIVQVTCTTYVRHSNTELELGTTMHLTSIRMKEVNVIHIWDHFEEFHCKTISIHSGIRNWESWILALIMFCEETFHFHIIQAKGIFHASQLCKSQYQIKYFMI
jgi:hypothetical protein